AFPGPISYSMDFYFNAGSGFFVGMRDNTSSPFQFDCWQYDPSGSVWKQTTGYPSTHYQNVAAFSISGVGYVLNESSSFWKYDTASGNWTQLDSVPFPGYLVLGMTAFSVGGKGYVGLGESSKAIWQYDPVADSWKQMGNFPGVANTLTASFVI